MLIINNKKRVKTEASALGYLLLATALEVINLLLVLFQQEKMTGQRGKLRALAGICHAHESYF